MAVCNVQDSLFALFRHLQPEHSLHTLKVDIHVNVAANNYAGYAIFTSNYAERLFKQNTMREFRDIRSGDLSRAHITAFLTDPLRTIRKLRDGKKKGKFTLDYVGKTGKPWRELQVDVRELVQGDSVVPDYRTFRPYFSVLESFIKCLSHSKRSPANETVFLQDWLALGFVGTSGSSSTNTKTCCAYLTLSSRRSWDSMRLCRMSRLSCRSKLFARPTI